MNTKKIASIVIGVVLGIILLCTLGVERIDAGHVGIKVNMAGGDRGISKTEYVTGWVVYFRPTTKVYEFPTYQQHIDYDEQTIITRGGFQTKIKPSFNYSINPGTVADMFASLRRSLSDLEQQWLNTAIVGSVNDVANLYMVDSIFNHRAQFETEILKEVNHRVGKWFTVSQLRTNITPPDALRDAIVAKTKALQDVQVAENQRLVAVAEADRKMAEARGDSAQVVIAANGEARAIEAKQKALQQSPQYVELIKAQRWDGKLPQYQLGNGGGTFLQLPAGKN